MSVVPLVRRRLQMVTSVALELPAAWGQARGPRQRSGVNVVHFYPGPHVSPTAVLDQAREALTAAGISWVGERDATGGRQPLPYGSTLASVQPANLPLVAAKWPKLFARANQLIALCYLEVTEVGRFPRLGLPLADEIWTISEYCARAYAAVCDRPVRVFPLMVPAPGRAVPGTAQSRATAQLRSALGLGEAVTFGYSFDSASDLDRKNPLGVVAAYCRAFPRAGAGTRLVLKTVNAAANPAPQLRRACAGRPDIQVVDAQWGPQQRAVFYQALDAYVSLHRAEGFGLTVAEAMGAGLPVIATGYSGNLDFCTAENTKLVPYELVRVGDNPVYPARARWAAPDLEAAAAAMREIAADAPAAASLGARAVSAVAGRDLANAARWLATRLPEMASA